MVYEVDLPHAPYLFSLPLLCVLFVYALGHCCARKTAIDRSYRPKLPRVDHKPLEPSSYWEKCQTKAKRYTTPRTSQETSNKEKQSNSSRQFNNKDSNNMEVNNSDLQSVAERREHRRTRSLVPMRFDFSHRQV
eukprot:gb/GECH01014694.1/.p1 GENE.gb/GECH01014694.1/~~gb/GECH01014694.1/.p1  ORF type:complete len:134 (+),score=23.90 gb/GECH01014694.1/:1-402(+)